MDASDIVGFWREAGPDCWWAKDEAFDAELRRRFADLHMAAAARVHDDWLATPEGALALVLLTDQLPRNIFRGTGHAFATDGLARRYAHETVNRGHDRAIEPLVRAFLYLPFEHSEAPADQDRSVALFEALARDMDDREAAKLHVDFAYEHRDIITRFGRFPHRNPALGRKTTDAEREFLDGGGFAD